MSLPFAPYHKEIVPVDDASFDDVGSVDRCCSVGLFLKKKTTPCEQNVWRQKPNHRCATRHHAL